MLFIQAENGCLREGAKEGFAKLTCGINVSWHENVGAPSLPNEEKHHFITFKTGFMEQASLDLIPSASVSFSLWA